jgi:hypothetical protein
MAQPDQISDRIRSSYIEDTLSSGTSREKVSALIDPSQIPLSVKTASGSLTDRSGSASTTSSQVMAANTDRKYLVFHNLSGSINMWINFGSAATNGSGSIQVGPKDIFEMSGSFVSTQAVNVISGSGTPSYTAKEG